MPRGVYDRSIKDVETRFWNKVSIREGACWEWNGAHTGRGYGLFWDSRKQVMTHRHVYELLIGGIPSGKEIDHLCRNHNCVNPEHLEPVPHIVNVRRGKIGTDNPNSLKTHCPHGHPYTKENTLVHRQTMGGLGRMCRVCLHRREQANLVTKKEGG